MAFTPQERKILDFAKQNGKSLEETRSAISKYRGLSSQESDVLAPVKKKQGAFARLGSVIKDIPSDIVETGQGIVSSIKDSGESIAETLEANARGEQGKLSTISQIIPKIAVSAPRVAGEVFKGAMKLGTTEEEEEKVVSGLGDVAEKAMNVPKVKEWVSAYEELKKTDPERARNIIAGLEGAEFLLEFLGTSGARAGAKAIKPRIAGSTKTILEAADATTDALKEATRTTANKVGGAVSAVTPSADTLKGGFQSGKELLERIPRAVKKGQEASREAADRATRIANSPKPVQGAIKAGLDDKIINTVTRADKNTVKDFGAMVQLAKNSGDTLTPKVRPSKVAGDAVARQYDTIIKQKRAVGSKIGEATAKLSKTTNVPMRQAYIELNNVLRASGLDLVLRDGVIDWPTSFSKTGFTKAQRSKIVELYTLATEGGGSLTPSQLYKKDRLFSQLQREARMDGIGDIFVEIPGEARPRSLFGAFRDVFSKTLDNVSPDDIRVLNKEYRDLITVVDDIEGSIVKTPNFNITKTADPAEFAKINLRRIMSEAQSQAAYMEIAKNMDTLARSLGYDGANPIDLIAFSEALKKIYPDTIPPTSLGGALKNVKGGSGGVDRVIDAVIDFGAVGTKDQQEALEALIKSLTGKNN